MKNVIIFTLGAAAGSLLTWKFVEQKYKRIADEEIESVREVYRKRSGAVTEMTVPKITKEEKEELEKQVQDLNYTVQTEIDEGVKPYVITPEEYGEVVGYDARSWTIYADNVITDEDDVIVSDPESMIGDGLEHFGDYDDCAVFVRNENLKCDYEILKHNKTYEEINGSY